MLTTLFTLHPLVSCSFTPTCEPLGILWLLFLQSTHLFLVLLHLNVNHKCNLCSLIFVKLAHMHTLRIKSKERLWTVTAFCMLFQYYYLDSHSFLHAIPVLLFGHSQLFACYSSTTIWILAAFCMLFQYWYLDISSFLHAIPVLLLV